ncbi:MAG: RNA-binding cell elongation regulator Jag/EloR [Anaerolineae bacterium]|nr:RNA-binding cell elongation regulator Jag/EloR [Anaerolineae bacterium]
MPPIEVTAPDVETAIEQGLQQLKLLRAEVRIEVLDEGSRGVLGFGARPARVRLTPYAELTAGEPLQTHATPPADAPAQLHTSSHANEAPLPPAQIAKSPPPPQPAAEAQPKPPTAPSDVAPLQTSERPSAEFLREGEALALNITRELLNRMGFRHARLSARTIVPSHPADAPYFWVDVTLDRRSEALFAQNRYEALNALQAVVQTLWSHKLQSSLRVNIDLNGYRARREKQLVAMARRLAERVAATGKTIVLEPMPALERRIIHLALRDDARVYTESTGEGESRKVQIKPRTAQQPQ